MNVGEIIWKRQNRNQRDTSEALVLARITKAIPKRRKKNDELCCQYRQKGSLCRKRPYDRAFQKYEVVNFLLLFLSSFSPGLKNSRKSKIAAILNFSCKYQMFSLMMRYKMQKANIFYLYCFNCNKFLFFVRIRMVDIFKVNVYCTQSFNKYLDTGKRKNVIF